ncbi:hypothetical protein PHISCL_07617 [Aspergillus sclerotialis]|uniref:Uncharacterized protein n=1 Tax=Aspergillus sclerotialis TaxID=2070753 RepID=A0A3A2ZL15_9EURO|nr:hypothetical protein PHISCL_07617 [Aspergillus sclerotialis]
MSRVAKGGTEPAIRVCEKMSQPGLTGPDTQQGYSEIPIPKDPTEIILVGSTTVGTKGGDTGGSEGKHGIVEQTKELKEAR